MHSKQCLIETYEWDFKAEIILILDNLLKVGEGKICFKLQIYIHWMSLIQQYEKQLIVKSRQFRVLQHRLDL